MVDIDLLLILHIDVHLMVDINTNIIITNFIIITKHH